jgi:NADH-quinone oxidoreductase subunit N
MSARDLVAILPLIAVAATCVALMLALCFGRSHRAALAITLVGLAAACAAMWPAWRLAPRAVTPLLIVDRYALFFTGLVLGAGAVVALLSYGWLELHKGKREELYVLLTVALTGAVVLASSCHFASFFLGVELLSVSFYALAGYQRGSRRGIEAGIKYLVLGGTSSAFLVFGMALVYAQTGTMHLPEVVARAAATSPLALAGFGMIVVGIGYKLALVPFHQWAPDVYEGAPAPVAAFIATVAKGSVFALLLRFFTPVVQAHAAAWTLFALLAALSMLAGNLLALLQDNVKRILAYSSIAHMGYALVAFLAVGPAAVPAVGFYFVSYFIAVLGAFGVVSVLSGPTRDADSLDDYRGLAWRRPWLAGVMTAMLLSLAGIPLTVGFIGKFYLVYAGVRSGLWTLCVILVLTSVVGLFYYLRVVVAIFRTPDEGGTALDSGLAACPATRPATGLVALAALTVLLIWFGVYPGPLIHVLQTLAP